MHRFRLEPARRGARAKVLRILVPVLLSAGCRLLRPGSSPDDPLPPPEPASKVPAHVDVRDVENRPRLALVVRQGDPAGAVALAVSHDLGAQASVALSALFEARLRQAGLDVDATAHGLGLHLVTLADSPQKADRFVAAASESLRRPVRAGEPALTAVAEALERLHGRPRAGEPEAAVAACSGELVLDSSATPLEATSPAGVQRLELWRSQVAVAPALAIGAVGRSAILDATAQALHRSPAWPLEPAPQDAWPARDEVGFTPTADGDRSLSVALRVADPSRALQAARLVERPASTLRTRLEALDPGWTLQRSFGTVRPRGACLRVEATAPSADPPNASEVARAAAVVIEEAEAALAAVQPSEWVLDQTVLRPADPRHAAAVAAWRSLAARHPAGDTRLFVNFNSGARPENSKSSELAASLRSARRRSVAPVDKRVRLEPGQGELWALLASPCGTRGESAAQAGLASLLVGSLSARRRRVGDVILEPWVSTDGYGVLAHAPRRGPEESPQAHAERLAAALGRAVVGARVTATDVAQARSRLIAELGQPRAGFETLLGALAPEHPSWLDPRGTWESVGELSASAVEAERRAFINGPLRLAVIANWDEAQAEHLASSLSRWLGPLRTANSPKCSEPELALPRPGEYRVQTSEEPPVSAYVAVALPPSAEIMQKEAEWTVHLLNRDGGWLDQALRLPGLASSARATLLGGSRSSAIAIAVHTVDESRDAAIAQVRALLERLAAGAATAADLQAARSAYNGGHARALLDPRRRLVELWEDEDPMPMPDLASLRRLHRAFAPEQHVVVRVAKRP